MGKKMMKIKSNSICFLTFLVWLLQHETLATSQNVGEEGMFDDVIGTNKGLDSWGELLDGSSLCDNGDLQSPINIVDREVIRVFGDLESSYQSTNGTIVNRGHDIMVNLEGGGEIILNGIRYFLKQCHWHSPSEHTFNGWSYPLELHMVHEISDNKIAVVGVVYDIGSPDPFLLDLMDAIRSIAGQDGAQKEVSLVDPRKAIYWTGWTYYRYMGSLTTPPCTEGVIWTIREHVQSVSQEQVNLLREAVNNVPNARPVQPTNGREVYRYHAWVHDGSFSS